MGTTATLKCRWCGRSAGLKALKQNHGKWAPVCLSRRIEFYLRDRNLRRAGHHAGLLRRAGLTRMIPFRTTLFDRAEDYSGYDRTVLIGFWAVTPVWAYEMADRLTKDKELARRLGYTQKRRKIPKLLLTFRNGGDMWENVDLDKVVPMELRVKIMRAAANSEFAREVILDDSESAAILIRDLL